MSRPPPELRPVVFIRWNPWAGRVVSQTAFMRADATHADIQREDREQRMADAEWQLLEALA